MKQEPEKLCSTSGKSSKGIHRSSGNRDMGSSNTNTVPGGGKTDSSVDGGDTKSDPSASGSAPPKSTYTEGEKVLAFHGPRIYEAKVQKVEFRKTEWKYFVHYTGWNKSWDEWVGTERLLKFTNENVQKQQSLEKGQAGDRNIKSRSSHNKPKDPFGEGDFNLLLDTLFTLSASGKSNAGFSNTSTGVFDLAEEESDTCFELSSDSDIDEDNTKDNVKSGKKAALMKMKFAQEDIDLAISHLGSDASVADLIDFIIAAQIAGSAKRNINSSTGAVDGVTEVVSTETLFTTMDKTLQLLQMGFTEEEISIVMDNHDEGASVCELADLIFASRIAHSYIKKEKDSFTYKDHHVWDNQDSSWNQSHGIVNLPKSEFSTSALGGSSASNSNNFRGDLKEISKRKRPTWMFDKTSLSSSNQQSIRTDYENKAEAHVPYSRNDRRRPSKPPFFFFGNVIDISHETWMKLCSFLDAIEPELVNTQFFSAFIRKEGYIHNLPTENRSYILPRPSMTIEAALPRTKRWWPSWDTRKKLSCLASETQGVDSLCERLGGMMTSSRGILSKVQQTDILHQCRTMNLLWVAENKLRLVEADEVEQILGYPPQHTGSVGLNESNRMRALKHAFQTDTLGYYLSSLKWLYPEGIRVISVFTGIGGAELALSGLGIHLQCVISIEGSEVNRKILRKWWQESGQTGELRHIERTEKLSGEMVENIIEEFGGIDLVIAGNPSSFGSPLGHGTNGVDIHLFFEFVRIFQRVKGATRRR